MSDRPANPPLLQALRADAREWITVKGRTTTSPSARADQPPGPVELADLATLPGFWCVVLWRLANALHDRGLRPLSRLAYFANMVIFGADLAPGAVVGPGMVMPHPVGVGCASDVVFGSRARVMGLVRIGGGGRADRIGHPVIGDDVWLMDGAKLFGPITVGDRAVVGANAMVGRDVPADTMVVVPKVELEFRLRETAAAMADA